MKDVHASINQVQTTSPAQTGKLVSPKWVGCLLALAGFFVTTCYVRSVDVFIADFATTGMRMLWYNFFRVVFLFYISWLLAGAGWLLLDLLRWRGMTFQLARVDHWLLGFFLGAALVTLVMVPLGFLNLYYPVAAYVLSVPV